MKHAETEAQADFIGKQENQRKKLKKDCKVTIKCGRALQCAVL
jgi:hypothetical protein